MSNVRFWSTLDSTAASPTSSTAPFRTLRCGLNFSCWCCAHIFGFMFILRGRWLSTFRFVITFARAVAFAVAFAVTFTVTLILKSFENLVDAIARLPGPFQQLVSSSTHHGRAILNEEFKESVPKVVADSHLSKKKVMMNFLDGLLLHDGPCLQVLLRKISARFLSYWPRCFTATTKLVFRIVIKLAART